MIRALFALIRSPAAKWIVIPAVTAVAYWHNPWAEPVTAPGLTGMPYGRTAYGNAAISPAPAQDSFLVASGITLNSGLMLLNDRPDFRSPGVRTVAVDTRTVPGALGMDGRALVGKTITARGTQAFYRGQPQIRATTLEVVK